MPEDRHIIIDSRQDEQNTYHLLKAIADDMAVIRSWIRFWSLLYIIVGIIILFISLGLPYYFLYP